MLQLEKISSNLYRNSMNVRTMHAQHKYLQNQAALKFSIEDDRKAESKLLLQGTENTIGEDIGLHRHAGKL